MPWHMTTIRSRSTVIVRRLRPALHDSATGPRAAGQRAVPRERPAIAARVKPDLDAELLRRIAEDLEFTEATCRGWAEQAAAEAAQHDRRARG
jgi:hypothetical protein